MVQRQKSSAERTNAYRRRMRDAGLRPVQMWVPDTRSPAFIEACRRQSAAVAASDPAGDEVMDWLDQVRDWPDD